MFIIYTKQTLTQKLRQRILWAVGLRKQYHRFKKKKRIGILLDINNNIRRCIQSTGKPLQVLHPLTKM